MYYKLPIKERMDLMKSYKKANKDMSYSDMVNDYNTSYQRFDNGGEKPWGEMNAKERTAYLDAKEANAKAETTSRKQATKEHYQDYVKDSMKKTLEHPMFNTAQYFTPEGMAVGAIKGLANVGPDVVKGDYSAAAFDALTALPAVAPAVKNVYNISKLPKFNNVNKSEINWKAWNKEIPENKALINEYNTIEQTSKANGSWMKNADGSAFQGTPEQFVQKNSSNFKKAFPEGATTTYRGAHQHIDDFVNRDRNDYATFLTDNKVNAESYIGADALSKEYYHPNINKSGEWTDGLYQLGFQKNLPKVVGEAEGRKWRLLNYDENVAKNIGNNAKHHNEFLKENQIRNTYQDVETASQYDPSKNYLSTDNYATYVKGNKEAVAQINNVKDQMGFATNIPTNTVYAVDANRVPLKSLMFNNGMFDMTNPNIYKSVVPIGLGAAALQQETSKDKHRYGGIQRFDNGGEYKGEPIITNDRNNPRLKAYNDSLSSYELSNKAEKLFNKNSLDPQLGVYNQMADKAAKRSNIKPVTIKTNNSEFSAKDFNPGNMEEMWMAKFKKPVQPYIYKKPEDGGELPYSKRVEAYNDSTILFNSGFGRGIPNQIYNPQFNAAKKRLTELNKKEPQSTDYYRSYANHPEYLKTHSIPYAKPTYPKKDIVLPEKKEKTRTDIYTNKDLFDKAYKAETDSSNAYTHYKNDTKGWVPANTVKNENKVKDFVKNNQTLKDAYYNKTEDAITYFPTKPKKPVVHNVYQPPPPPEKMIPIEARIPKDIVEPELKTSPKDFGYRRIGWRNDPNTNLQVPVLLTHPKMKVKQGERIYNKEIPTSTMAIPKDWEAEFSKPEETKKTDTYWRRK